jgi:hypothetical protein
MHQIYKIPELCTGNEKEGVAKTINDVYEWEDAKSIS